jgi:hypothetical protein
MYSCLKALRNISKLSKNSDQSPLPKSPRKYDKNSQKDSKKEGASKNEYDNIFFKFKDEFIYKSK